MVAGLRSASGSSTMEWTNRKLCTNIDVFHLWPRLPLNLPDRLFAGRREHISAPVERRTVGGGPEPPLPLPPHHRISVGPLVDLGVAVVEFVNGGGRGGDDERGDHARQKQHRSMIAAAPQTDQTAASETENGS